MSDSEFPVDHLPSFPSQAHGDAWERVLARMKDCKTRDAIRFLLCGWSYRESARAAGANTSTLWQAAERYELLDLCSRTDRIVRNHRRITIATQEALLKKAEDGSFEDESARDLAVIGGISSDKIRDFEKQQEEAGNQGVEFFESLIASLTKSGVELKITVEPAREGADPPIEVESIEPHAT